MLVQFVISESVKVEQNPLQVNNQYVWSFCNQYSLTDVNFLVAAIALVVIDNFSLNLLRKWLVDRFYVFNCKR